MTDLRFAIFGAGFWANFQIPAWFEVGGVQPVAIYNRTVSKAQQMAERFGIPHVYADPEAVFQNEQLDFVDIITAIEMHAPLVHMAAKYRVPVICQKPMATDLASAEAMTAACRDAGVPYFVHENWRWQTPIRAVKRILDEGAIGKPFRARIEMVSGFLVFDNQPFLRDLEQFILSDIGSHLFDAARFLFGEAASLYCQTRKVHADIRGEDVATVLLEMGGQTSVICSMGYPGNYMEREAFPQTFLFIEGDCGSLELDRDYWVRVTTGEGTLARRYPPPRYTWADPVYDVVHASIVPCNANLLCALKGEGQAETTGEDNLKTMRLVFAAYDSAAAGRVIHF